MFRAAKAIASGIVASDDTPLGRAFNRGQLESGGRRYTGEDRYAAGLQYQKLWDVVHCNSSQAHMLRVNNSFGPGGKQERKAIAKDQLDLLEGRLSVNSQYILRAFLGEGASGSEAVSALLAGFEKSNWHAICLSLDELLDASAKLGNLQLFDAT
jgi:hypothetical protein